MYSVVLMAALTTGTASEAWCFRGGCYGGGCYGGGCYGGGCWGGGWGGGGGWAGANYNGCYGWAYSGCYGGSYYNSSCYGYAYGGGLAGAYGNGHHGAYGGGWNCYGGYTCYGWGGNFTPYSPYHPMYPPAPTGPVEKVPAEKLGPPKGGDDSVRAKVFINVPVNATLFVDDMQMPIKSGVRMFVTPPLEADRTFFYDVKLVVMVNGKEQAQTTRLIVRRGDVVTATFPPQNSGTATAGREE